MKKYSGREGKVPREISICYKIARENSKKKSLWKTENSDKWIQQLKKNSLPRYRSRVTATVENIVPHIPTSLIK